MQAHGLARREFQQNALERLVRHLPVKTNFGLVGNFNDRTDFFAARTSPPGSISMTACAGVRRCPLGQRNNVLGWISTRQNQALAAFYPFEPNFA